MNIVRIDNPNELRPVHVALLGLVVLALAGNCLLTSAAKPDVLPDGAVEWDPDSLLLAVVELLDLEYAQPTPKGVAIKKFVHGLATGIGLVILALSLAATKRDGGGESESDTVIELDNIGSGQEESTSFTRKQLDPIRTSQVLLALYIGWSFLSAMWSHAPEFAISGSVLLAVQAGWAFVMGYGLNRRAATVSSHILIAVLVATAVLANAYSGERNPTLRASYPIGNPLFLAACLIPAMLVAGAGAISRGIQAIQTRGRNGLPLMFVFLAAIVVMARTFEAARSRGPALGLAVGVLALAFFAGRRKVKWIVGSLAVVGLIATSAYFIAQRDDPSPTGRSASMRARFYAWNYAIDLFQAHPIRGNGQGGYTLQADALAVDDVQADPAALDARIAHAHSEWLEVASDLGSVGIVLVGGAVLLALTGGIQALRRLKRPGQRIALIALLASLVALVVDECTSPGLRHAGLPLVFYTVLGLVWALSAKESSQRPASGWPAKMAAIVMICVGLAVCEAARRDFAGARARYEITKSLQTSEWNEASYLAEVARTDLLDPHDKLLALRGQIECHQLAAATLQAKYISRRRASESTARPDPILVEHARQARADSEAHLASGYAHLDTLRAVADGAIAMASVEYGLRQIHALYADIDGNAELAAALRLESARALERQLNRQPYNPQLAVRYVVEAAQNLSISQVLDLLAQPLRVTTMPPAYLELLGGLTENELFAQEAEPVFAKARNGGELDPAFLWIPEKLRIAAVLAFVSQRYDDAVADLRLAAGIYDDMEGGFALSRASCHAELADALFAAAPTEPQAAIDEAELTLKYAPQSQLGRALCDGVGVRLISYHLASGHEDFARKIIARTQFKLQPEEIDAVIAEAYVRTAFSVFDQLARTSPQQLDEWAARTRELAPESPSSWALAAELAILHADASAFENAIRQFTEAGGTPEAAADLLQRAAARFPDNETLKMMLNNAQQMMQQMSGNTAPDASQQGPAR